MRGNLVLSFDWDGLALSAFGENHLTTQPPNHQTFFTGEPMVEGLGYAFLMRNYRAGLAKWQTADPIGYPDGWNQLAYCNNGVTSAVDLWGCYWVYKNLFYFKKIDFEPFVVIPGGLPISVNPTPPTIVSALVSWIMGLMAQGASNDVKPNWELIKYFANESGFGDQEPTTADSIREMTNQGYGDWEYVSDGFFWENHESEPGGEGEFVSSVTICWKVVIRKWEE